MNEIRIPQYIRGKRKCKKISKKSTSGSIRCLTRIRLLKNPDKYQTELVIETVCNGKGESSEVNKKCMATGDADG